MSQLLRKRSKLTGFWIVLSIWVVCLFYLLFEGGKIPLMLLAMLSILTCYWAIGRFNGIKRLRLERKFAVSQGYIHAGEHVSVSLTIMLPKFISIPYLVVSEMLQRHNGEKWSFESSVVPNHQQGAEMHYVTPPLERGTYNFAPTTCQGKDLFGIITYSGNFSTSGELRVLPRTIFIPHWNMYSGQVWLKGSEFTSKISRRETTQINGIRDYAYGDKMSRIHWAATAKTGSWKSKEFERETLPKIIVVLDAHQASYKQSEQFELAVSTAASILEYGIREGLSIGLCTLAHEITSFAPIGGVLSIQQMLRHLVDLDVTGSGKHEHRLESISHYFTSGCFFVFISPTPSNELQKVFHFSKSKLMTPYHIQIGDNSTIQTKRSLSGIYVTSLEQLPVMMGGGRTA
jgi:uncharacterized protein (DUF58 family)